MILSESKVDVTSVAILDWLRIWPRDIDMKDIRLPPGSEVFRVGVRGPDPKPAPDRYTDKVYGP